MSLVVENEIQWLTEIILPKILRNGKLIDDYNESLSKTFQVKSVAINVIGVDEAYMLTICYRATIELKYAGQELQKKLFIKKTPKLSAELYDVIQFDNLFNNEVVFYTEILPVIQELSNGKFAAPKYYYSEINSDAALIILSDFASDGWNVTKDLYGLSLEHARIAVKYLGTFHGFGFAMKHKQPQRFQQLTAKLREARFAKETLCAEFALKQKVSLRRAERAAALYQPQIDKEFISKFQQLIYNYIGYGRQRVAPREPLATLCHGDYLRNNVAFKYDTNGTPLDIMMFDHQTMRLSSPMIDLSVFLALSLLAEVRCTNFDTLFDGYCNALAESYRKHSDKQLPEFLSRENLLKEYIQFLPYAINITSYFLMSLVAPLSTSPAENFESEISTKEIVETAMNQGGELVDRELAHQLKELYELSRVHNVQIDENIDISRWSEEAAKFINDPAELYDID